MRSSTPLSCEAPGGLIDHELFECFKLPPNYLLRILSIHPSMPGMSMKQNATLTESLLCTRSWTLTTGMVYPIVHLQGLQTYVPTEYLQNQRILVICLTLLSMKYCMVS